MSDIDTLNDRFSGISEVQFRPIGEGIVTIEVNALASALISLHGGQVVRWWPKSQATPVLWASDAAQFTPNKAIRAGVPICWPWFGAHPTQSAFPGHGFARISPWSVTDISVAGNRATVISLSMLPHQTKPEYGLDQVALSLRISVGESLEIALTTSNKGNTAFQLTEGLHTYFRVGDVREVRVCGLEGDVYADLVAGTQPHRDPAPIRFDGELGRLYLDSDATAVIEDPKLGRLIRVEKTGSLSTAVWNPGPARAATMDDFAPGGWESMACVESANAMTTIVNVPAGTTHTLSVAYSAETLPDVATP